MRQTFHPAMFLGGAILLCAAWLWARPAVSPVQAFARGGPRPALVEPAYVALDTAILERYVGRYEGRGDFTVALTLEDGKLFAQAPGGMPFELRPTSETEFFLRSMGYDVAFDVGNDGTVRGFSTNTEYGLVKVKRVR